jgi:hypothetical protein
MGPVLLSLVTLTAVINACVKQDRESPEQGIDKNTCIEVTHIGSQDVPVGRLRLCVGETGRSRADSLHENKWTFYFDVATFRRLTDFVVKNSLQGPIDLKSEGSSFSVAWRGKDGAHKYIVAPEVRCAYLDGLVHTVTGAGYAEFREVGVDMMAREGCERPPSK